MAKLSARGRYMLVEVSRERTKDWLQDRFNKLQAAGRAIGDKPLTIWERQTRRLMSDGSILEKLDVRFQPDHMDPNGRRYSYNWKVHGKLKAGLTADDFLRIYRDGTEEMQAGGRKSTWEVTNKHYTVKD